MAGSETDTAADRGKAGAIRCPAPLGEALHGAALQAGPALREDAGLSYAARAVRPEGQVPQRIPEHKHFRMIAATPSSALRTRDVRFSEDVLRRLLVVATHAQREEAVADCSARHLHRSSLRAA